VQLFFYLIAAWFTADALTGLAHWAEDRYGDPNWTGWVGRNVIQPNIAHHEHPRQMLEGGYFHRNWTTIAPTVTIAVVMAAIGQYWFSLVFLFASQGNEIHGWSHQKCNRFIRGLQLLGILCSPEHHASHHENPFDRNYCVLSDCVNPLLSAMDFWFTLESVVWRFTGVMPIGERETA
jgi:hypothetical protein